MNAAAARHGFRDRRPAEYLAAVAALPEGAPDTVCGGCFRAFATLAETFAHDCERVELRGLAAAALTDEELVEVPDRFPVKPGRREAARAAARGDNQYPGPCTSCGATVEPFDGKRAKVDGRWVVRHLACPVEEAPRSLDTPRTHPRDPEPDIQPRPARTNRYAAPCVLCGVLVAAEAGSLSKGAGGWETRHVGPCPSAPVPTVDDIPHVPEGHYAIESTGTNDLAFYRVDRGTGAYAGRVFVKRIIGGRPEDNVQRSHVPGILARIAQDPDAGPRYGREIGRCCRCNRTLTDEASRLAGIGPDCATRD